MARSRWNPFGAQLAQSDDKALVPTPAPPMTSADAKKFGLVNFGNTCYANSVLQALYFCAPFRDLLLQDVLPSTTTTTASSTSTSSTGPTPAGTMTNGKNTASAAGATGRRRPEQQQNGRSTNTHHPTSTSEPSSASGSSSTSSPYPIPSSPSTLHSALRSLFLNISTTPGEKGTVAPRAFIDKLKELNELFRSTMHQDAHEFLNYLLNRIVEEIEEERKTGGEDLSNSIATLASPPPTVLTSTNSAHSGTPEATLVHKLFEGTLTSETRCLTCETVSSRDESFLDLSIDIEENSSVTACLRQFSASEMLCQRNKFFCDACCDLQEAEKRMKIKRLPNVLALHLKRFKYQEDVGKYIKLAYRVAFPFELRLFNTVDDIDDADRLYNLYAIVVHIGNGPHHGHYISIIKSAGSWLVFDDDNVSSIPESDIPKYFGDSNSGSAYVLYYQAVDLDLASLGLRAAAEPPCEPALPTIPSSHHPILPPGLTATTEPIVSPPFPALSTPAHIPPITLAPPVDVPPPPLPPPRSQTISFGTKIKKSMRRVPSTTATAALSVDTRRSASDRWQSTGSVGSEETSAGVGNGVGSIGVGASTPQGVLTPPPVPPLPGTIKTAPSGGSAGGPMSALTPTDEKRGGWFRKRKSIKVGKGNGEVGTGVLNPPASPQYPIPIQPPVSLVQQHSLSDSHHLQLNHSHRHRRSSLDGLRAETSGSRSATSSPGSATFALPKNVDHHVVVPPSIASSANNSTSTTESSSGVSGSMVTGSLANGKRPGRKLSLGGPILGFGKKRM